MKNFRCIVNKFLRTQHRKKRDGDISIFFFPDSVDTGLLLKRNTKIKSESINFFLLQSKELINKDWIRQSKRVTLLLTYYCLLFLLNYLILFHKYNLLSKRPIILITSFSVIITESHNISVNLV